MSRNSPLLPIRTPKKFKVAIFLDALSFLLLRLPFAHRYSATSRGRKVDRVQRTKPSQKELSILHTCNSRATLVQR
jgi:hypothetical protein